MANDASPQAIAITSINTDNFPQITANYQAFDGAGKLIENLRADQFTITESYPGSGGPITIPASSITHGCVPDTSNGEASVMLIIDQSQSMLDPVGGPQGTGTTRWKVVQQAVDQFIRRMRFSGESRICLVSFSSAYHVWLPNHWTNDFQEAVDTLYNREPSGGTQYQLPFDQALFKDYNVYALFKERPRNIPRYIFFLTDGNPSPDFATPAAGQEWAVRNSDIMNQEGIRFFSVSTDMGSTHLSLQIMAGRTGGRAIEMGSAGLVDLFGELALETQLSKRCHITWTAPYACTETSVNRTAVISVNHPDIKRDVTVNYTVPAKAVASTTVSPSTLYCGDPPPTGSDGAVVTITAVNATEEITGYTISPNTYFSVVDWGGTPPPFTLKAGESRKIRVKFTQGASRAFHSAVLTLEGTPCPPVISLVGGTGQVNLATPVGGEVTTSCDTLTITWNGVKPTQPVILEYSNDGGNTWKSINAKAYNLIYKWLPPAAGTYRIRVSVAPEVEVQWATSIGDSGNETATAVAVCADGTSVYASGWFDGPGKFGTIDVVNEAGDNEGYLVKLNGDGIVESVLLLRGAASNDERITGVVMDTDCNYYITGYFTSANVTLGASTLSQKPLTSKTGFVYKFNRNGIAVWSWLLDGNGTNNSSVEPTSIGLRMLGGNLQVIVAGTYQRYMVSGRNGVGTLQASPTSASTTDVRFYAIYLAEGNGDNISLTPNSPPPGNATYSSMTTRDSTGMTYTTGSYTGAKTFGTPPSTVVTIGSRGKSDVFIMKQGAPPASADTSATFTVVKPVMAFTSPSMTMTPIAQGQSSLATYRSLKNTGTTPIKLSQAYVNGLNFGDFRLVTTLVDQVLNPGDSIQLEFEFTPTGVGSRKGSLVVKGTCGDSVVLPLDGNGLPPCNWEVLASKSIGKVPLGATGTPVRYALLKNTGPNPLSGTLAANGDLGDLPVRMESPAGSGTYGAPGAFTLPSMAELMVEITPQPQTAGQKRITFTFSLAAECGQPDAAVIMEVIVPRVEIDTVDFGRRRLMTINDGFITITNSNTDAVQIERLDPVPDPTNSITANNPAEPWPGTPFTIQPGQSVRLGVRYQPVDRNNHRYSVFASIQGKTERLEGVATGTGYLPVILARGHDFGQVTISQVSATEPCLTIRNDDASSNLNIYSISGPSLSQFTWDAASEAEIAALATTPKVIAPLGEWILRGTFAPTALGVITATVDIQHDAKPGPDALPPYATTTVQLVGEGIAPSVIPPVDFGDVLACLTKTVTVTVKNSNGTQAMTCQPVTASGDKQAFTILGDLATSGFVVPPAGEVTLQLQFNPVAPGTYSVQYVIPNDQSQELVINAKGNAVTETLALSFGSMPSGEAGKQVAIPVNASPGPRFAGYDITDVTVTFTHDDTQLRLNGIPNGQTNWVWTVEPIVTPGTTSIHGTSVSGGIAGGLFVTPVFDVFLNNEDALNLGMTVTSKEICVVGTGDDASVTMIRTCNATGRMVKFGVVAFSMNAPAPNPAADNTVIRYGAGLELETTFTIVDQNGTTVRTYTIPALPSAEYELSIPTSEMATGLYWVRMNCGPYTAARMLTVVR